MMTTAALAVVAARQIAFQAPAANGLGALLVVASALGAIFLKQQKTSGGKTIEVMSGLWSLGLYLSLGILPLLLKVWRAP